MSSSLLSREINTGTLEVDRSHLNINVRHKTSTTPPEEWDEVVASTGDGYSHTREVNFPRLRTDRGVIAKEIAFALKRGREVGAWSNKLGRVDFIRIGPFLVGYSGKGMRQTIQSVGWLGLKRAICARSHFY